MDISNWIQQDKKKLKEIKFLNEFLTKKKLHSQEDDNSMQCVFFN